MQKFQSPVFINTLVFVLFSLQAIFPEVRELGAPINDSYVYVTIFSLPFSPFPTLNISYLQVTTPTSHQYTLHIVFVGFSLLYCAKSKIRDNQD